MNLYKAIPRTRDRLCSSMGIRKIIVRLLRFGFVAVFCLLAPTAFAQRQQAGVQFEVEFPAIEDAALYEAF